MNLHPLDLVIIGVYLLGVAMVGVVIRKRATKKLDSYYLADRNIPWWMLGLSGCSSYIDIGGTMAMVGLLFYLGLKSIWITHIFWGWFMICLYMAFQAKYIRRSGVMTFAEWNETRFRHDARRRGSPAGRGDLPAGADGLQPDVHGGGHGQVRRGVPAVAALAIDAASCSAVVGVYVTLGGFFGVILTDVFQTLLIAVGAVILTVLAFQAGTAATCAQKPPTGVALAPTWSLWSGYARARRRPTSITRLRARAAGGLPLDDLPLLAARTCGTSSSS